MSIEWLAGAIDADGSVGIYKRGNYYTPSVKFSNTDPDIVIAFEDILDQNEIKYHIGYYDRGGNRKPDWRITIEGKSRVKAICELVLPHLRGKKKGNTELVLRYFKLREGKRKYTDSSRAVISEISMRNKRGR